MSVLRQLNALGQMRVDVPHLRSIESSVAGDFDVVVGRGIAGDRALVVRGFTLSNSSVGTAANEIQLVTADSIVYNINASESGSFLWVPSDRALEQLSSANAKVSGSFTANAVNYVGIDFKRTADDSTTDLAQFLDANTKLESGRNIPLGRTLDYVILISTAPFSASPNITPIAKITTDASNKVASIQDARPMLYRLASGGDFPNTQSSYAWPFGRQETAVTDKFTGGDKNILSNKDWMDAVMSRLWDLGGGENWYSPTHPKNIRMIRAAAPNVFSNGENWETIGTHTHWRGLSLVFENANNSGVYYNEIKDQLTDDTVNFQTQLAVGECLYVDVDFTQNRTGSNALVMKKASLQSLGTPTVPGSRLVIAWRSQNAGSVDVYTRDYPYLSNVTILPATTTSVGGVRLNYAADTGATPTVVTIMANNVAQVGVAPYAIVGNNPAFTAWGGGTAAGLVGNGGTTSGTGVQGFGGPPNGNGMLAAGAGTGYGITASGGATNAAGGFFQGGGTTGPAIIGLGAGSTTAGMSLTNVGATFKGPNHAIGDGLHALGVNGGVGIIGVGGASSTGGIIGSAGTGSNGLGVRGTGNGTGSGVVGLGDPFGTGNNGTGVAGTGGVTNGKGVTGQGAGTGVGVHGTGGGTNAAGVLGTGGATNGVGVQGQGTGTGAGGVFTGGASDGNGVTATAIGTGTGVDATADDNGIGVSGLGGAGGGVFTAKPGLAAFGVSGTSNDTYPGVWGICTQTGPGGQFESTSGTRAVVIPNNQYYGHTTAVSKAIHVPIIQFRSISSAIGSIVASQRGPWSWQIASGSGGGNMNATVRIPAGATVTAVQLLLQNTTASSLDVLLYVTKDTYNAAGAYTQTNIDTGNPNTFSIGATSGPSWVTISAGGWTSTTLDTDIVGGSEGFLNLGLAVNNFAVGGGVLTIYAARVLYTMQNFAPAL